MRSTDWKFFYKNLNLKLLKKDLNFVFSNFSTIRKWNINGDCTFIYEGHSNYVYRFVYFVYSLLFLDNKKPKKLYSLSIFVFLIVKQCSLCLVNMNFVSLSSIFCYSIALIPGTERFVSSGEDRCIKVWKGIDHSLQRVLYCSPFDYHFFFNRCYPRKPSLYHIIRENSFRNNTT